MKIKARSLRDLLIHLGIMVGIVVVLLVSFFYIYLPITTNHGESITVPDLVGMSIDEVGDFLEEHDLRYEVIPDSGYSEDQPPNTVLLQEPTAESQVKEGRKIYLTLNAEDPPKVAMPDLVSGSSYRNAQLVLKSLGLRIGEISYRPDVATETVLEQNYRGRPIKAGTLVPKGSEIDLVLADGFGNRDFAMPLLKGLSYDEALFTLNGSDLALGEVTYLPDTAGTPGMVVDQYPNSGNGVRAGDRVNITVFEGEPELDESDSTLMSPNL